MIWERIGWYVAICHTPTEPICGRPRLLHTALDLPISCDSRGEVKSSCQADCVCFGWLESNGFPSKKTRFISQRFSKSLSSMEKTNCQFHPFQPKLCFFLQDCNNGCRRGEPQHGATKYGHRCHRDPYPWILRQGLVLIQSEEWFWYFSIWARGSHWSVWCSNPLLISIGVARQSSLNQTLPNDHRHVPSNLHTKYQMKV